MGTDKDWEKWGATDPYFGVLSHEQFRADKLDLPAKSAFFASGESHVARVIEIIRANFDPDFAPGRALDFGCGVGRLVIPLAKRADEVVGVDVSPSMLSEAQRNCALANVNNVTLVQSGDLSCVNGQFHLVHSYIVLQHIPWLRGRKIVRALSDMVAPGGYLAVQMYTSCHTHKVIRALVRLRYAFPPANWARNLLRKRPIFEPAMQVHAYDLSAIKTDLERNFSTLCIDEPNVAEFGNTFLFARRISP
jgi:trans-aconitate methyltransferase